MLLRAAREWPGCTLICVNHALQGKAVRKVPTLRCKRTATHKAWAQDAGVMSLRCMSQISDSEQKQDCRKQSVLQLVHLMAWQRVQTMAHAAAATLRQLWCQRTQQPHLRLTALKPLANRWGANGAVGLRESRACAFAAPRAERARRTCTWTFSVTSPLCLMPGSGSG